MPPAAVTISSGTYRQKEQMIFFASPDAFLSSISFTRASPQMRKLVVKKPNSLLGVVFLGA